MKYLIAILFLCFFQIHAQQPNIRTHQINIARDSYGVPHIFAPTDPEVAYGLAWAHSEDDFKTIQTLRAQGVSVQMHAGAGEGMGSMKSQFKKADGSGATLGLIFGGDELARGEVTLKALRDGAGAQEAVPLTDVTARVQAKLAQSPAAA